MINFSLEEYQPPEDVFYKLRDILLLIQDGKKQKAKRKLQALRNAHADDINIRKITLKISYELEDYEGALEDARFLVEHEGDDESKLYLADCLLGLNRYQEAGEALARYSELAGKSAYYHFLLGVLKVNTDRREEANEELRKAISLEPESGQGDSWVFRMATRFFMAVNLLMMGKTISAREQARLAAKEAMEPGQFFEYLEGVKSDIIRYEALAEAIRIGKIKKTPEFSEILEVMRLAAMEEEELLQENNENL